MAHATHQSLLYHNPHSRPFLLTRSTYPSFSRYSSHWLGDNLSTFPSLRQSLSGLLQFTSIYQNPHVGADVCGFLHNTTEELCARWAAVGALAYPFYRNHAVDTSSPQEYYRWDDTVGEAARRAIEIRYRLLDYMYTAMERQSRTGEASLVLPLWFLYPEDPHAADIQEAFFLGDALLVSPVLYEGATSVDVHIPPDSLFYRFDLETYNFTRIHGSREMLSISGIDPKTPPPLHIRAGCAIPLRTKIPMAQPNARTTTELRRHNFEVFIAPDDAGYAEGSLYIDDGMSHRPREDATSLVEFTWSEGRVFTMRGRMNYQPPENSEESTLLQYVYILGAKNRPRRVVRASPRHEGSGAERGEPRAAGWRDELEIDYYPSAQMLVAWVSAPMARDLEGGGYSFEVLW